MDQNTRGLILQLCSYAGGMMEDASVPAVTAGGLQDNELLLVTGELVRQVRQISALLNAAAVLVEVAPM